MWLSVLAEFFARRCATTGVGYRLSSSPSSCVSVQWFWEEFPAFLARAVDTWKYGALFPHGFVSGSSPPAQCLARQ